MLLIQCRRIKKWILIRFSHILTEIWRKGWLAWLYWRSPRPQKIWWLARLDWGELRRFIPPDPRCREKFGGRQPPKLVRKLAWKLTVKNARLGSQMARKMWYPLRRQVNDDSDIFPTVNGITTKLSYLANLLIFNVRLRLGAENRKNYFKNLANGSIFWPICLKEIWRKPRFRL